MKVSPQAPPARLRLFYKESCPPCRSLARIVVAASLGTIRRVALGSAEAAELHRSRPEWAGQLLLADSQRDRFWLGAQVFRAVPLAIAAAPWRLYRTLSRSR